MGEEHLKKLKAKGDAYSDAVRAKLKGSSSDKRKIACQISALKRANPETIEQRAMQLATNPKTSATTIMKLIQQLADKDNLKNETKINLIKIMCQAHTTIFGNKVTTNEVDFKEKYLLWLEMRNADKQNIARE